MHVEVVGQRGKTQLLENPELLPPEPTTEQAINVNLQPMTNSQCWLLALLLMVGPMDQLWIITRPASHFCSTIQPFLT